MNDSPHLGGNSSDQLEAFVLLLLVLTIITERRFFRLMILTTYSIRFLQRPLATRTVTYPLFLSILSRLLIGEVSCRGVLGLCIPVLSLGK